jgi:hypothetical protein
MRVGKFASQFFMFYPYVACVPRGRQHQCEGPPFKSSCLIYELFHLHSTPAHYKTIDVISLDKT